MQISPGVETSLIDESLYVSNSASLVPLFFIATQDEKTRPDGEPAYATYEHSVIRSITSLRESINAYGNPNFLEDSSGEQQHGDCRNEYGVLALNQYLGIGGGAYVVRANVNLNDNLDDLQDQWDTKCDDASVVIQNMIQNYINTVNLANGITTDGTSVLKDVSTLTPAGQLQTEKEFSGTLPYGSYDASTAANFEAGDIIMFSNGAVVNILTVDEHLGATVGAGVPTTFTYSPPSIATAPGTTLTITSITNSNGEAWASSATVHPLNVGSERSGFSIVPQLANSEIFMQSDVNFVSFSGGMNYIVGDVITMNNGAEVKVIAADASGVVSSFVLKSAGNPVAAGSTLSAISVSPVNTIAPQTGFSITVEAANLETMKYSVSGEELKNIVVDATDFIFDEDAGVYAFRDMSDEFYDAKSDSDTSMPTSLTVYPNGFDYTPSSETYIGFDGSVALGVAGPTDTNAIADEWTPAEGADLFGEVAANFKFTQTFYQKSSLGANDAARRVSIVSALQSAIVSNTDVRSENFMFNVVACPGYPEVVDELIALSTDQKDEVFVVADTPANLSPAGVTNPTNGWAATSARQNNNKVAYYYPWCYTSNLDGVNVLAAPSGTAIRQFAYSDDASFLWYAPAGVNRGLVTGITDVGYASGVMGNATTFVPVALNQGQRDALYQDTGSGKINPIVYQPGRGIAIMGQKTSSPTTSALDRINVVRLTMYVRRQLRLACVGFLFEPNDQHTRDQVKAMADNFLSNIVVNRGIIDYLTVCDSSNNTADVVDRSELILDCLIKPTKAVEFISIPIRVVSQGADI